MWYFEKIRSVMLRPTVVVIVIAVMVGALAGIVVVSSGSPQVRAEGASIVDGRSHAEVRADVVLQPATASVDEDDLRASLAKASLSADVDLLSKVAAAHIDSLKIGRMNSLIEATAEPDFSPPERWLHEGVIVRATAWTLGAPFDVQGCRWQEWPNAEAFLRDVRYGDTSRGRHAFGWRLEQAEEADPSLLLESGPVIALWVPVRLNAVKALNPYEPADRVPTPIDVDLMVVYRQGGGSSWIPFAGGYYLNENTGDVHVPQMMLPVF